MDVTVIIPAFKDRGYLDEAITSALQQDFLGSWQIILASDGNPDLVKYAKKYGIDFSLAPKGNLSSTQNRAMKIAKGKYIKGLADDDLLLPNTLTDLFNNIGDNAIIYANAINFNDKGGTLYKPKNTKVTLQSMLGGCHVHGGTTMFLKDLFFEVGGRDEGIDCCEDYDFYFKLLINGYNFTYVDKTVYKYRLHATQKSYPAGTPHRDKVKKMLRRKYEKYVIRSGSQG